ncbi:unnamed protein product [Phytomonas sp. EM1]|nr:unnamed protein product [Phytomonas sp. EM1]|eukprot:CCW62987.1 unnamed protein product [Phytomonas sp. isolate EM1]
MQPGHVCTQHVNDKGIIVIDDREYPMASEVVATEDVIQRSVQNLARRIAEDYKGLKHLDTCRSLNSMNREMLPHGITSNSCDIRDADSPSTMEAPISEENPLIILSVLKGSYVFTADFVRYLGDYDLPHVVDFIRLASYNDGTESSGTITLLSKPKFKHLNGKHVLILEDVCDSGRTMKFLYDYIGDNYKPKSLKTLVFMNKPSDARKVEFEPEYKCLDAPNKYVIGYGFEINDRYRNLRHVFVPTEKEKVRFMFEL